MSLYLEPYHFGVILRPPVVPGYKQDPKGPKYKCEVYRASVSGTVIMDWGRYRVFVYLDP